MVAFLVPAMVVKYNPQYQAQMAMIENQLAKYLAGGTALNKTVENQIYERSKDKITAEYLRALDTADKEDAKRGFTLPRGAKVSARQSLRKDAGDNLSRAAVEIAIKQAEMEQANLQFGLTQSKELRVSILNTAVQHEQGMIQLNGMALDYGKEMASLFVEIYKQELARLGLAMDIYKAKVGVFESMLKASQTAVDIYRAEVEALNTLTNVDRAKVELYNGRINALNALAGVYKTEIEAVVQKAELEKIKLDVYKTQTESYSILVQAKTAEWEGYKAQIGGQTALADMYRTQIEGYKAQLSATQTSIDAKTALMSGGLKYNEALVQQYQAQVGAFSSMVNAKAEVAKVDVEVLRADVARFQAEMSERIAAAQVEWNYKASVNGVLEQGMVNQNQINIETAKIRLGKTEAIANAAISIGKAYESAASAGMASMISLTSQTINSNV